VTLKSYTQADVDGGMVAATYDLYFPSEDPRYLNGLDGELNTNNNKAFIYNALTQKFEWGAAGSGGGTEGSQLFIQGQTITEHMDEHGSALTVAREVPLVPGDPGYLDPSDPAFVQKFKVEYKFTDELYNMKSFQCSKADELRPQLSSASGLFFDWTTTPAPTLVTGGNGETYYTNDDKAKMDKVCLQTHQEKQFTTLSPSYEYTDIDLHSSMITANLLASLPVVTEIDGEMFVTIQLETAFAGPGIMEADSVKDGMYMWLDDSGTLDLLSGSFKISIAEGDIDKFTVKAGTNVNTNSYDGAVFDGATSIFTVMKALLPEIICTLADHGLQTGDVVAIETDYSMGVVQYISTTPNGVEATFDGAHTVLRQNDSRFFIEYAYTPLLHDALTLQNAGSLPALTIKKFEDLPSKEQSKVDLEPSRAEVKHLSVDQTSSQFSASRNELELKVLSDPSVNMTRLESAMLPYESKWSFSKSTKLDKYNAIQPGVGVAAGLDWTLGDDVAKAAELATLTPPIIPPATSEEGLETNDGFLCLDNSEKKLYTDMETFEFGPSSMRHRLFVAPDASGNSRLYIQKHDGVDSWVGADVVVDEYAPHTSSLTFDIDYYGVSTGDPTHDNKIGVTLTSLTGILDNVHFQLDDAPLGSASHLIQGETFDLRIESTAYPIEHGGVGLETEFFIHLQTGMTSMHALDFVSISSVEAPQLNGTHIISQIDTTAKEWFKIVMTVDSTGATVDSDWVYTGGSGGSGTVMKLIKCGPTLIDAGPRGPHKIVAYGASSDHKRVSEFSTVSLDTASGAPTSGYTATEVLQAYTYTY